ncbi:MAG: hypothetical protein ACRCZF_06205, partial [Gemmataceae bacterium]
EQAWRGAWALDTGGTGAMIVDEAFVRKHNLLNALKKLGTGFVTGVGPEKIRIHTVLLPRLTLAGHTMHDVPIVVKLPLDTETRNEADSPPDAVRGVLCMDVLARYHTILDLPNDKAYFRPNSRFAEPFPMPSTRWPYGAYAIPSVGIVFVTTFWAIRRRRYRHRLRTE